MKNNINYGSLSEYVVEDKKKYLDILRSPLQDYCKEAIKQFGYLDNQGLALDDDDNQGGPVYIDDLYVLPKAGEERISPEMLAQLDDVREEDENSESINDVKSKVDKLSSIAELIWKNPRLTLLGDPGVGKTTLMQWLICSLCHWSDNHAKQYLGPMFPLTITARKISEKSINELNSSEISLESFIDEILSMQGDQLNRLWGEEEKECLYSLFERGQVLLLVDGLDEISSNIELWLNNKIRDLLIKYPSTHLIMTARVVGFNQFEFWGIAKNSRNKETHVEISDSPIEFDEESIQANKANKANKLHLPKIYFLAPFSPSQRKRFSENWVANYLPPNDEKRKDFIDNIDEVSAHSFQLDALSRIPVLLNLICFIQWRRGKLPNGRAELYQRIVETYLVAMDRARLLTHELSDEYDYHDIKNWLGRLAFNMQSGDLNLLEEGKSLSDYNEEELEDIRCEIPKVNDERILQISSSDLIDFFQLHLTEVVPYSELQKHSEAIINYLKNRTGFLIPRGMIDGEEYFGFSHLSFQEYFSAYFLNNSLEDLESEVVTDIVHATNMHEWNEVLQLLFEEMSLAGRSRTFIDKWLGSLFPENSAVGKKEKAMLKFNSNIYSLYGKIINNSSIKISNVKRFERKERLVLLYLQNPILPHSVLSHISNEIISNWKANGRKPEFVEAHFSKGKVVDVEWVMESSKISRISFVDMNINEIDFRGKKLEYSFLDITNSKVESLSDICTSSFINELHIIGSEIGNLEAVKSMNKLETFHANSHQVREYYEYIPSVKKLVVNEPLEEKVEESFNYLSNLGGIEELELYCSDAGRIPRVIKGESLTSLSVLSNNTITSYDFIYNFKSLKKLFIYDFNEDEKEKKHIDINFTLFGNLLELEEVFFNAKTSLDVNELLNCRNLKTLFSPWASFVHSEKFLKFEELKELTVDSGSLSKNIIDKLESNGVNINLI